MRAATLAPRAPGVRIVVALTAVLAVSGLHAEPAGAPPSEPAPKAAPSWTLEAMLQRAASSSNPQVRASLAEADKWRARGWKARAHWIPDIDVQALFSWAPAARGDALNGYTDMDRWGPLARVRVDAWLPLYRFGETSARVEEARAGARQARAEARDGAEQTCERVRTAWWAWAFAREAQAVLDEARGYLDRARKRLEDLEDADDPNLDPTDALRLRLVEAQVDARAAGLVRVRQVAAEALRLAAGAAPGAPVAAQPGALDPGAVTPAPLEAWIARALAASPTIAARQAAVRRAEAAARRAARHLAPVVGLSGFYRFAWHGVSDDQRSPFAADDYNHDYGGVGLALRWDGNLADDIAALRKARADVVAARARLEAAHRRVREEVGEAWYELHRALGVLATWRKAARAARSWAMAKSDLYEGGLASMDELSEALAQYFAARLEVLGAALDARNAAARLGAAAGEACKPGPLVDRAVNGAPLGHVGATRKEETP